MYMVSVLVLYTKARVVIVVPASHPLSNSDPKYSVEAGGQSIQHSGKK